MRDLSKLGFDPPDLGLPEGNCRNGHPWANNAVADTRGNRACAECRRIANRKSYRKKTEQYRRAKADEFSKAGPSAYSKP